MLALPTDEQPTPILWRLLVDQWHQRRGIARRAIGQLAEMLVAWGATDLDVRFVEEPGGPEHFYATLGFERTGRIDGDQVWATASLTTIIEQCGSR
jgi:GNAT superfamily N-acetyltransferase